jgi:uncharacterized protein YciI
MRLGPLRKTCVQPAPKSRLAVFGPFVYEEQKQSKSRAEAEAEAEAEADQQLPG